MPAQYIIETRLSRKTEWTLLCEGTFDKADCEEFFANLDREDDGLYRYRMLPEFGFDTRLFSWAPPGGWQDPGPLILSRHMPQIIHQMNDEYLRMLGV